MFTPSADQMRKAVKSGKAMPAPGQDRPGRFPIRNRDDLGKAIRAVGRVPGPGRAKVRRFIIKRARALNALSMIPATWNTTDGSLK